MVCIVAIFVSSMLLSDAARASGLAIDPFAAFVTEPSKRFAAPEHWIRAVMHVESRGQLQVRSQNGAIGLMQVVPKTGAELCLVTVSRRPLRSAHNIRCQRCVHSGTQ